MIKVPLLDLKAQYRQIAPEVERAVRQVLDSQEFILGPVVQRFEDEAARYLKARFAVGVASGSDALLLSLMALAIGPGDAVLVPAFTFFSTASAVVRLGATPILIDVEPEGYLIDPGAVERFLREQCGYKGGDLREKKSGLRVKALLPVHLFGQTCSMSVLRPVAREHGLKVVEDVAQGLGARIPQGPASSKAAGTAGDLGCFSFFPSKTLGGIGDGGLVATNKESLARQISMLRVHGEKQKYRHEAIGINSRLDAIQAAVLTVKLRHLDQWCEQRIARARAYEALFTASGLVEKTVIRLPDIGRNRSNVFNYYVIRARSRDKLKRFLGANGIQSEIYYPVPLHLQPCFSYLGYQRGDLPHAEQRAAEVLALPLYPEITDEQQQLVVDKVVAFYRKKRR